MKMKNNLGTGALMETSALKAYCDKHVPEQWRRDNDVCFQTIPCYIFSKKLIIVLHRWILLWPMRWTFMQIQ